MVHIWLFVSSSRSLVNISYISILFLISLIIFTIIILNSFSRRLPISTSFGCFSGVLSYPFIRNITAFSSWLTSYNVVFVLAAVGLWFFLCLLSALWWMRLRACVSFLMGRLLFLLCSHQVASDGFQPHGLNHTRLPCPSPSPRVCPSSCPLNWWYHPTISFSCHPLLLLPSIFPSIKVFSSESALHIRWPKYWSWSFSFSISANEYLGLISFNIDWFDCLEVQGTLKSLIQHHSSKASILPRSALFMVQLSHLYMITGKTWLYRCLSAKWCLCFLIYCLGLS